MTNPRYTVNDTKAGGKRIAVIMDLDPVVVTTMQALDATQQHKMRRPLTEQMKSAFSDALSEACGSVAEEESED